MIGRRIAERRSHRRVRRFNRFYTRQLGVLRKTYLDSPYSLGEARVLYEIANGASPTASDIGRALDLDAGYLSRMLRNFEKRGLIVRKVSASDARQSHLTLSAARPKGVCAAGAAFAARRRRNARPALARRPGAADRGDGDDRRVLDGRAPRRFRRHSAVYLRPPEPGDFGWIVKRHAELYAQEYGWMAPFEGVCAQIVADFVNKYDAKRERCWIAEMDGENVGSIMLAKDSKRSPASACCWWTRKRAGLGSARGSPTNAFASRATPATRKLRYGRTAC